MEILFWIWVLTWLVKTAATDVLYAWSGKPNPRYELKKARAVAAGKPAGEQPRYGTREWAADLWSDALAANTARRRGRQVTSGPVDDMLDVAEVRPSDSDRTPRDLGDTSPGHLPCGRCGTTFYVYHLVLVDNPDRSEGAPPRLLLCPHCIALDEMARAQQQRQDATRPVVPPADEQAEPPTSVVHTDQHPYCVTACSPDCPAGKAVHGWRCPWCRAFREGFATEAEARADGAGHTCPAGSTTEPASTTPGEQPTLATVIPMFPNLKEILMSDTTTEVIGLDQSIGYTKALATFAGTHGSAGNEGYIGVLTKAKVAGKGLTTAHQMQEAFDLARAAAEAHATELEKQKTIQEAYDANPDAGDKDYMQQGR